MIISVTKLYSFYIKCKGQERNAMKVPRLKQKRYQHVNIIELETFLIRIFKQILRGKHF